VPELRGRGKPEASDVEGGHGIGAEKRVLCKDGRRMRKMGQRGCGEGGEEGK